MGEPVCYREAEEKTLAAFREGVENGEIQIQQREAIDQVLVMQKAIDKARLDCEQHTVDWRALAQELQKKLGQRQHPNTTYDHQIRKERLELRQKLVQAGYDHPDHAFVETFDRAVKDNKNLHALNKTQRDINNRLRQVIQKLGSDDAPDKVERAQNYDKLSKEHSELQAQYNALLVEHSDARTMRDVYKVRCEKQQKHAQRPVEWKRTVEDVARLASLYTHDLALPTSTEGEKALGRAVEYLVELVKEGRDLVEATSNGLGSSTFENWARGWFARVSATEPIVVAPPSASPAPPEPSHDPARVPNCPCRDCFESEMKRG